MPYGRSHKGFSLIEVLLVVALIGIVSAFAVPMISSTLANLRVTGDVRSTSNAIALAKMHAAANFTRTRLYVDLSGSHHLQRWNKTTSAWDTEGGSTQLSTLVSFGHGVATNPPPHTQGAIDQAAACKDDMGNPISNTACVIFNSRGVPIDSAGNTTADDAIYLTDGTTIFAVTVSATGMVRTWRAFPDTTASWILQ